ncbi:hypothetical protein BaRGS_00001599 [Batillaria attramentaria]|uniref:Uncharacterized protein n=1 Tax=Batillaria attramentaria TaxID=370345 RepID=A0ABD0M6S5_9CAEN
MAGAGNSEQERINSVAGTDWGEAGLAIRLLTARSIEAEAAPSRQYKLLNPVFYRLIFSSLTQRDSNDVDERTNFVGKLGAFVGRNVLRQLRFNDDFANSWCVRPTGRS